MGIEDDLTGEEIERHRNARVHCFIDNEEIQEFDQSSIKALRVLHERETRMLIDEDNVFRYNHGRRWVRSARENDDDIEMQTISTEWSIPFKDIADGDLGLIERVLLPVVESMSRQFADSIYGTIGAAAEKVGNVVSSKDAGSNAQSFLEMLKKVEFGVDRDGQVSLPQIHAGPEMAKKMIDELDAQPSEFKAEVERVKAEKSAKALAKEAVRKAKFRTPE